MPVIAVANPKGGVGKTTLAIHIAAGFVEKGRRVLLIDADPQGSALDWKAARGEGAELFPVVGIPRNTVHREIASLSRDYDLVVIDGCPGVSSVTKSVVAASDMVLVPVQPSPFDVWATRDILGLIADVLVIKMDLIASFVVSRKIVGTVIGRSLFKALSDYPIGVLRAEISQRVPFPESLGEGKTVLEIPAGAAAATEIRALVAEIMDTLEARANGR